MARNFFLAGAVLSLLLSCKSVQNPAPTNSESRFSLAFGSCNKHDLPNLLWDDILTTDPDLWVWGGDIIYADTADMEVLQAYYRAQNEVAGYKKLRETVPVTGTWDDHDYGLNDGGANFEARSRSQVELLSFLDVPRGDPRWDRPGIYSSEDYAGGRVKVLILDTRYFRSPLIPDTTSSKRYQPGSGGTILGDQQWQWLENELHQSEADFNLIVSSIQVLSSDHGFETWGNFPEERRRLLQLIADSGAANVVILSGDRHISEFSKMELVGVSYPLIDFTSSGLTHAYTGFSGEYNPYRVGDVVPITSFGHLEINLQDKKVVMRILGDKGRVLGVFQQQY